MKIPGQFLAEINTHSPRPPRITSIATSRRQRFTDSPQPHGRKRLDDHFDEGTKRFKSGWDDAKIAAELDASPEIVPRIRREALW